MSLRVWEMRCFFVYNPVSGKGKIVKNLDYIVSRLKEKYDEVETYATKCAGDMERAARDAVGKYDAIVFSGGDGSFNEVVQGVGGSDIQPELGYIPCGTVNDIAHTLGIPRRIKSAVDTIVTGVNEMVDCMQINDRYAMYVVAAGAFTSASYTTPQKKKKQIGRIAYGLEGIKKNMKFNVFDLKIKSGEDVLTTSGVLVLLMNGRYVAGMRANNRSSIQDGKLELAVIKQKKNPDFLKKIRAFIALIHLFLRGYSVKEKQIYRLEGSEFEIDTPENVVWNFDGEKGLCGKVSVRVLPKKINVIVPKHSKNI